MKKRMILLTVALILRYAISFGQGLVVTGTVTDAKSGDVLPGVSIAIKGTNTGTITDVDGKYRIEVPNAQAELTFSYVGYLAQTVAVEGRSSIDVGMSPDVAKLDEVVVVGYGTAKRGNLTTAQTTVSARDMEKTVNTTIEQAIQGRTAGVYITQNSGQPGGGISVNIRGVNSINGTNEPLYVIDGVQIAGSSISFGSTSSSNPLAGLNPSDIQDIQILQGPSATALYGSRATNGVLLITTKRGKAGDTRLTYNYQYSLQTPPQEIDVMNLRQYAQYVGEFHSIAGGTTPVEFLDPTLLGEGTNWQSELFRNTAMNKHQLSLSGGQNNTNYYFSGEYLDQEGVAVGSGFNRYSFRLNLDSKAKDWISFGTNLSFNQTNENLTSSQENLIANGLQLTPQIPVKNLDGSWGGSDKLNGANQYAPVNPVAISSMVSNENTRKQFTGSANLNITILKGLVFTTSFNTNLTDGNSSYFVPAYEIGYSKNTTSTLTEGINSNRYWNLNQLLNYNRQFDKHSIDVMVSHEAQESKWKNISAGRNGFLTNDVIDLNAGDEKSASNGGGQGTWSMESYFGRINYSFADKYILNGSVRRDGSSNFGPDNKWGIFPALSAAWRISKESFWFVPFINEFKIRLETGKTGNQGQGGIYGSLTSGASPWGAGFLLSKYSNPGIKWEETRTDNIGLNIGLLENRFQFEFDYYNKNTDNLLMDNPLPYYMGSNGTGAIGNPTVNIGSLNNKGWGFTFISTNINARNFQWETNFNISGVKTKVTKFYSESAVVDRPSWWMNNWVQRSAVGQAPWMFLGYQTDGLYQSIDDINNSAVPVDNNGVRRPTNIDNIWVGDVKYKDISGPNGVPDGIIDIRDQTFIGNPWPKLFGGFTNTFRYKGLELNVLLTYTYGNDIYNYLNMVNSNPNNVYLSRNFRVKALEYARLATDENGNVYIENPGTTVPRIANKETNGNYSKFSDKWVEDGSFIKVKSISLAYSLPKSLLSKQKFVKDTRIVLSAQNVATLTKYNGYDPEVGAYVGRDAQSFNQAQGVDYGRYPLTPIYTFNVIINF